MLDVTYDWINLAVFVACSVGLGIAILLVSSLLGPKKPTPRKLDPYECGVPILGSARERFSVHFYLVAIMFMLFDIETVFLIPWAVIFGKLSGPTMVSVFISMIAFVAILGFGLLYLWRRGVLDVDQQA